MSNSKKKNNKMVKVTEAEYLRMRRDQRVKKEIKQLGLQLFDKIKNWK